SLKTSGRSAPMRILSSASSKQFCVTASRLRRAASSAASLTRLARSAPTIPVGAFYCDTPVKATRTQQGFIKPIGSVGGGDHHYRLARIEAVHLHQQLVERLLAFIVAVDA